MVSPASSRLRYFVLTRILILLFRDEALHFILGPNDKNASVHVIEHKTLGKDKVMGTAEVDVSLASTSRSPDA